MKSRAHIKGHPLHPILVSFPIAFFTGTLLFDVLSLVIARPDLFFIPYYLEIAGVGFALLAAVPGIIDFIYTVPPKSSGKKRAAKHGLTNACVILIFLGAWLYRQRGDVSAYILIPMELVGFVLLSIAGWMGGTLVYRNQIGVNPRYAGAGKWKEIYVDAQAGRIAVADTGELKVNQMKLVHVGDRRIVLGRTEEGYCAFDDHCTHRGGSLAGGAMICGTVQCPWHGSQFDVRSGQVKAGPAVQGIKTYKVTEAEGKVYLENI
jgi:nitrite reductase/ring-hydroxylating ferredoxin subunit/uncharacterized membrane protein